MVSNLGFQTQIEVTHPRVRQFELLIFGSAVVTAIALTSAVFGKEFTSPKVRSLLLGIGVLSSSITSVSWMGLCRANERYQPYKEAQQRQLNNINAAAEYISEVRQEALSAKGAISAILDVAEGNAMFAAGMMEKLDLLDVATGGKAMKKAQPRHQGSVDTSATEVQVGRAIAPTGGAPQVFDDRAAAYRQNTTSQAIATQSVLPQLDVAQGMAIYDGHILCASKTGSGKTTMCQAAIAKTHEYYGGMVDFHIIDPKGASWLGLEHDNDYAFVPTNDDLHLATSRVETVVQVMQARQQARMKQGGHWETKPMPVILIIDEYNSLYARLGRHNKAQQSNFAADVQLIIFQGREDNVHVWMFSQTTRVQQLGLDTSVQDNMLTIALARNSDYNSIEDAIGNQYVVASKKARDRLSEDFENYKASKPNTAIPIAFSSSNSGQLVVLPDYSQYKSVQLQRKAHNQSTDEILAPEPVETTWIVDAIAQWIAENSQPLTVPVIQYAYHQITKQNIDEQGAQLILDELR